MLVSLIVLFFSALSRADRPEETSMCDYYTQSILGDNSESNQGLLMQLLTNTAIIGNYTTPNVGVMVPGFAAPGEYMGQHVELLPYFTGGFASTNVNGQAVAKLWLDDGGAAALAKNESSNGNITSAQYTLVSHVQQYFGQILGCSMQGGSQFPSYGGQPSMYEVHKFMDLSYAENSYLIEQFSQSAASLGFSAIDVAKFNSALDFLFNFRGSPPITLIPASAGEQLQAICIYSDCPLYPVPDLNAYPSDGVAQPPAVANQSLVGNATVKSTLTGTPTPTANVHYGCVEVDARDIADGAASSACNGSAAATGTGSAASAGSPASTSSSSSGAERSSEKESLWTFVLAIVGAALFGL